MADEPFFGVDRNVKPTRFDLPPTLTWWQRAAMTIRMAYCRWLWRRWRP